MRLRWAIALASLTLGVACGSGEDPARKRIGSEPATNGPTGSETGRPATDSHSDQELQPMPDYNPTGPSSGDPLPGAEDPAAATAGTDGELAEPALPVRRRRNADPPAPLSLVLRSTPPGAMASIDGKPVGTTPTYWKGDATGRTREFTFVLAGYALARYRFVPLRDGVVHATLERVADEPPSNAR